MRVPEEYSYIYILEKVYSDILVEICEGTETSIKDLEDKTVKGPGKSLSHFLQAHGASEEILKRVVDVVNLRPQQMVAYTVKEKETDIDVVLAMSKIRKYIFEGNITNKVQENVLERLIEVYGKYQKGFCAATNEEEVPEHLIKSVGEFYKMVVWSGKIESIIDHPEADMLFIENVDFKEENRTIVSGLKGKFEKDRLCERSCLFAVNLKPTSFKGTKSYGMILFAKDKQGEKGTVIFTETNGDRLMLEKYPISSLVPFKIQVSDSSKKTTETFFANLKVSNGYLEYNGMSTSIKGKRVEVDIKNGSVS